ncbi:MAG: class I SAM-dependent methyltransferase [Acidobacteria bacterium]|nr:class I SAM-dependent methyltransferase [Acidobacteriota bacterium]
MEQETQTFAFGKNWAKFVRNHLNEERLEISRRKLLDTLGRPDLEGATFLDVGCGSGIHSLAALRAGAASMVSFDVDPDSVATTRRVRETFEASPRWEVIEGSVLDERFVTSLTPADVVYSWGVLHHTGDLWSAIRLAASRVVPGGVFFIAVYIRDERSDHWIAVKKAYNRASWFGRRRIESAYVWDTFVRGHNLGGLFASFRYVLGYRRSRGMEFWTDVRDWLGGWPYEPATVDEICAFCEGELGLERIKVVTGEANVEYLFHRPTATS